MSALEEARERISATLGQGDYPDECWELEEAVRADVLDHLVIAVSDEGPDGPLFPAMGPAIYTRGSRRVKIDECDHRAARNWATMFEEMGSPTTAEMMHNAARAALERDLGNEAEMKRLEDLIYSARDDSDS